MQTTPTLPTLRLLDRRWPWPALAIWASAWAVFLGLASLSVPPAMAFPAAFLWTLPCGRLATGPWRRALVVAGFPVSALLLGLASTMPGWIWLVPLALLLTLYPMRSWRDAPMYPTAALALAGLDSVIRLPACARVLDAGSGLGHGLRALHAVWPAARIEGVEQSLPLAWWSRWRCRFAQVQRSDMWATSWKGVDLIYLFQRPDTMARAWQKAVEEMAPGTWMASLEFEVPGITAVAVWRQPGQRPVHVYRLAGVDRPVPTQLPLRPADKAPKVRPSPAGQLTGIH